MQRRSINRLLQWGQIALPNRCDAEQPGAGGDNGTRFPRRHPFGNRTPLFRRIPGCSFPMGAKTGWAFRLRSLAETASRNRRSDWDVFSRSSPSGKLRPGICARNGTWFPRGPKQPPTSLDKMIRFPSSHAKQPRSVPGCRQHFAATAKARAGNKCHLRGLGGRSQRYVTEAHVSYGLPNGTGTRCLSRLTKR